jgi:hypothetical protein
MGLINRLKDPIQTEPSIDMHDFASIQPQPPVSAAEIGESEERLGFDLPPLVRDLYTQVADGGYGPGLRPGPVGRTGAAGPGNRGGAGPAGHVPAFVLVGGAATSPPSTARARPAQSSALGSADAHSCFGAARFGRIERRAQSRVRCFGVVGPKQDRITRRHRPRARAG